MSERTVSEQSGKAQLLRHPASPSSPVHQIEVRAARTWSAQSILDIEWRISGDLGSVAMPDPVAGRSDGLWRTTCLEAFVAVQEEPGYQEFNLSPTDGWASYDFDGYREGMRRAAAPVWVRREKHGDRLIASARLNLDLPTGDSQHQKAVRLGFAAVIEDKDGRLSHWALGHLSDKPDFHDQHTFTLVLPAPEPS